MSEPAVLVNAAFTRLSLKGQEDGVAGLELADLVLSPIERHVPDKSIKQELEIVRSKFRTDRHGKIEGYRLVVPPRADP